MTRIKLQFVNVFRDRHGKVRYYFRRPGRKSVALRGPPGSERFMEAYAAALAGDAPRLDIGASRSKPGTVAALVAAYFASIAFNDLAKNTQQVRRNILERFRAEHGGKRVVMLQQQHIANMVAAKAATPSAARSFLNTMRALMQFAIEVHFRTDDPTQGVRRPRIKSDGFYTWSEHDITKFEAVHPVGSRARLAMALLLYTAQRRSDVVGMGPQHIRGGVLSVRQQKTGVSLSIPVHTQLQTIIDATPVNGLAFLMTAAGRPFTAGGFSNWFRDMCNQAGLPKGTSAHGLRKAACRRLAEAGCSANVIAAISGHKSLQEIQRYTMAADQVRMAHAGIDAMQSSDRTKNTKLQT